MAQMLLGDVVWRSVFGLGRHMGSKLSRKTIVIDRPYCTRGAS